MSAVCTRAVFIRDSSIPYHFLSQTRCHTDSSSLDCFGRYAARRHRGRLVCVHFFYTTVYNYIFLTFTRSFSLSTACRQPLVLAKLYQFLVAMSGRICCVYSLGLAASSSVPSASGEVPQHTHMTPLVLARAPDFPVFDQASFQRANVLMSMERHGEALVELEVVRDNVPKESAVYFLMGKVRVSTSWHRRIAAALGGVAVVRAASKKRARDAHISRDKGLARAYVSIVQ